MSIVYVTSHEQLTQAVTAALKEALSLHGSNASTPGGSEFISNKEAMALYGLSRPTLQRYRASGRLAFTRIGTKIWYRRTDLEELLAEGLRVGTKCEVG
jgi:excisionase family DNA binding protein